MTYSTPRIYHIILFLIVCLAVGVRLSAINRTMRWDEGRTFQQFAQRPPSEFLLDYSDPNNHFLNSLMMHIQYRLLGDDEDWKLRVHVLVIGVLVTIATYYTGKEIYDADVGLMASALSSVMYMLVEFSINARGYIAITLIFLLLIILINRMKTQANRRGWLTIGCLSALGFFVSPAFLYAIGTLGLWMILSILLENKGEHRRRILSYFVGAMVLGGVLTLIIYLPALIVTYGTVSALNQGDMIQYTRPVEDFFATILPTAAKEVFELMHTGMSPWLIFVSVVGMFIAMIFHNKLSKNRFPLFLAIPLWLGIQLSIQQTVIFERVFTFLTPIYAILISAGLISTARFLTRYRIKNVLLSSFLSMVLILPIAYQLVNQELLFTAWVTASMPYGRDVLEELQGMNSVHDILTESRYARVLEYYIRRDSLDFPLTGLTDKGVFENWDEGQSYYFVGGIFLRFSTIIDYHDIQLPDHNFVFEPIQPLTEHYYLYKIKRIPPTLKEITSLEQVDVFWFINPQKILYSIKNQSLEFNMFADQWKLFWYRYGKHWQDYDLSMRIKITEPSENFEDLLIQFRNADESNYSLGLNIGAGIDEGLIGFRLDVDNTYLGYLDFTPYSLVLNQWYDITIEVENDTFTAFIDGDQVLQTSDNIIKQGAIGFKAPPDAKVQIADIRLE
jgi:hypothetical protein